MMATRHTIMAAILTAMFVSGFAFSQAAGDFRSAASGNWSDTATWETFDGSNWIAAVGAPTGAGVITVGGDHAVAVDAAVTVSGMVKVEATGSIEVQGGSMTFADGSVYEHARDAGTVPIAEWQQGSVFLLTGTTQNAPSNRSQDFNHVIFNTPNLGRNRDMTWNGNTIGGDVRVVSTGANRWQMTSAAGGDSAEITIKGDVIVEAGQFAVQGTGNALTKFVVHHYGNLTVTGGNFSLARGSQGSGSGTTTWYLYQGNFSMSNAVTQNSNPTAGNAKLVFASNGTQQLTFEEVTYAGGRNHYEVADTTTLQITKDLIVNGQLVNHGAVEPLGALTMADGSLYQHARNGGAVPTAIWEAGSTALFTGITGTAPDNRGQDYHHLILNTPNLSSNRDLSLQDKTIGGDLTVVSTGSARWQMVGGSSGTVTIMGDVIVQGGQFATQGTSSATDVVVDHYGDVEVTGGNFSVARGSQGSGSGSTRWHLHDGNFSMSNAVTQNSNPTNARFVFAKQGMQYFGLDNVTYGGGGLAVEVADSSILDFGNSELKGNGLFLLNEGAALATAHAEGINGAVQSTGTVTLSEAAGYHFNGATPQVTGTLMPTTVSVLAINNPAGVALSQITTINRALRLMAGEFDNYIPFRLGPEGTVSFEGGSLKITTSVTSTGRSIPESFYVEQNYPNPFNPSTMIRFGLPATSRVTVQVFNLLGQEVVRLFDGIKDAGVHELAFDAADLGANIYLYRIQAGNDVKVRRMILVK